MESTEADKTYQKSVAPLSPQVKLQGIPERHNAKLTEYFSATIERTRFYWLLASLWRHQSVRTANAMAFDLFLALIPTLGLAGWAAALVVGSGSREALEALFVDLTPTQISQVIGYHFEALSNAHLAPFAALAGWWLSSSAFNTMIGVFEESFACKPRHWIHARFLALVLALLGMALLGVGSAVAVWATVWLHPLTAWFNPLGLFGVSSGLALLGLVCVTAFLSLVYRVSLQRPGTKRVAWPGATIATLIGVTASLALGYYATNIAQYKFFYGSLAAIVIVLFWLWLWSSAILIGAEINIALEDVKEVRNAVTSETEAPVPLGVQLGGQKAEPANGTVPNPNTSER